jgi:hypothetical protein
MTACLRKRSLCSSRLPGESLKAILLGWGETAAMSSGDHVTFVTPVRDSDLTDAQRRFAQEHSEGRIP